MRLLFLALTWTAVAAGPLFQTATSGSGRESELQEATTGSVLREMAAGLQEATPGSLLREMATGLQEATPGSLLREMAAGLQEATPGSLLREMAAGLQEATPGSLLREMAAGLQEATPGRHLQQTSNDLNIDRYLRTYGYINYARKGLPLDKLRTDAIKLFQKFAGLQVTGRVNKETRQQMRRPRCGMKDIEFRKSSTYKWNVSNITYGFSNFSRDLNENDTWSAIDDAFSQWSGPAKLNFTKVTCGRPMIDLRFVKKSHQPCPYKMNGRGGVIAHAFPPIKHHLGGDIHFDDDETFKYKEGHGIELASVALHEIGHSLGLSHDRIKNSIMFPWYNGQTKLGPNDIARIKILYT